MFNQTEKQKCDTCRKAANGNLCCFVRDFTPVPGWDAEKTKCGWAIKDCPNYIPDPPRASDKPKPIIPPPKNPTLFERYGKEAQALFESGASQAEVARKLHISDASASQWQRKYFLYTNKDKPTYEKCIGKVLELTEQGVQRKEIAKQVGASGSIIYKWLKKARAAG